MVLELANKLKKIADDALEQDKRMLEKYYKKIDEIMLESAKIGNHSVAITFSDAEDKVLDYIINIELQGIKNKTEALNIIVEHYEKEGITVSKERYADLDSSWEDDIIGLDFRW